MLDRTPSGRPRKKSKAASRDALTENIGRALLAFERLTFTATVVHTDIAGVLVHYDPEAFDELSALLEPLTDLEEGGDDESSSGGSTCRVYGGHLVDLDDVEDDGREPDEDGEPALAWTDREAATGQHARDWFGFDVGELDLESGGDLDQACWAGSGEPADRDGGAP